MASGQGVALHAVVNDQFGIAISATAPVWSVDAGGIGGTVSASGVYTAPVTTVAGSAVVRAAQGGLSGTVAVQVASGAPHGSAGSSSSGGSGRGVGALGMLSGLLSLALLRRLSAPRD